MYSCSFSVSEFAISKFYLRYRWILFTNCKFYTVGKIFIGISYDLFVSINQALIHCVTKSIILRYIAS